MNEFTHRIATFNDIPVIEKLMKLSIDQLLGPLLTTDQLEASFDSMGLDDQLIKDGTYFMIFSKDIFIGCGGWSNRETLFGGNHTPNRDDQFLDPKKDSARIRAMYTHPDWIRKGVGSLVMSLGEEAAKILGLENVSLWLLSLEYFSMKRRDISESRMFFIRQILVKQYQWSEWKKRFRTGGE